MEPPVLYVPARSIDGAHLRPDTGHRVCQQLIAAAAVPAANFKARPAAAPRAASAPCRWRMWRHRTAPQFPHFHSSVPDVQRRGWERSRATMPHRLVVRRIGGAVHPLQAIDPGRLHFGQPTPGGMAQVQPEAQALAGRAAGQQRLLCLDEGTVRHAETSPSVQLRPGRARHAHCRPRVVHQAVLVGPDPVQILQDRDRMPPRRSRQRAVERPPQRSACGYRTTGCAAAGRPGSRWAMGPALDMDDGARALCMMSKSRKRSACLRNARWVCDTACSQSSTGPMPWPHIAPGLRREAWSRALWSGVRPCLERSPPGLPGHRCRPSAGTGPAGGGIRRACRRAR